jgi:integrase
LTPAQVNEAELAFSELGERPLLAAVRYYIENYREPVKVVKVKDAFAEFIATKRQNNCRPDSIENYERKNAFLLRAHGDRNVSDIQPEHLKEIIFHSDYSPVYQNNLRRGMGVFFNWCHEQGYCKGSPMAQIEPVKFEREEPEVLPLSDVRALLKAASEYKDGVVLPYVAISLFAGVRPKELARLSWDSVNLPQKTITIKGKGAKMRARRIVEMSPNLVAWLKPFALAKAPFVGKNWRRDFDTVKAMAGYGGRALERDGGEENAVMKELKPWTIDVMRHSAISHHLAFHQHEGKTATWAGNSPDIVQKHYRSLVDPKDAKAYWSIKPADQKNIVSIQPAGQPEEKESAQTQQSKTTATSAAVGL